MYRIIEEHELIGKRRKYFIEREVNFLGLKWWSRNLKIEELDDNPYGYFYTYIQAKRAVDLIESGKTMVTKECFRTRTRIYRPKSHPRNIGNNHPHYDSDRKKAAEEVSLNVIGWSFIAVIVIIVIAQVF